MVHSLGQTSPQVRHPPPGSDTPPGQTPTPGQTHTPPVRHPPGSDPPPPGPDTPHREQTPQEQTPPQQSMLGVHYGQQACGTHPTGMHTCFLLCPCRSWSRAMCRSPQGTITEEVQVVCDQSPALVLGLWPRAGFRLRQPWLTSEVMVPIRAQFMRIFY